MALAATTIAVIGDSWVSNRYITESLALALHHKVGFGGAGWIGAFSLFGMPSEEIVVGYMRTGNWTDHDIGDLLSGGADLQSATAATGAKIFFSTYAKKMQIHYLRRGFGGSFRYRVNNGPWTTVNTSGAQSYMSHTTQLPTASTNRYDIEVTSGHVLFYGFDMQVDSGVRVHRLGNAGATIEDFANAPASFDTAISRLAPDHVFFLLGTNDAFNNRSLSDIEADYKELVSRITAKVWLLLPSRNDHDEMYGLKSVASKMVSEDGDLMLIDTHDHIKELIDLGLPVYANSAHLNRQGGSHFAEKVVRDFIWGATNFVGKR